MDNNTQLFNNQSSSPNPNNPFASSPYADILKDVGRPQKSGKAKKAIIISAFLIVIAALVVVFIFLLKDNLNKTSSPVATTEEETVVEKQEVKEKPVMTLKVPRWEKFVRIRPSDLNLRKGPSTDTPRLYYRGFDYLEFSWTQIDGFEPFHFPSGTILPVLSETDEWYCLYFGNYSYGSLPESFECYVMKEFCTEAYPAESMSGVNEFEFYDEGGEVKGGKGYLIGTYFLGSPSRDSWCRIGHKVNNYLVMADYDSYGTSMEFAKKYITEGESSLDLTFHPDRITEAELEDFLKSQPEPHIFDVWIKFQGAPHPTKFVFDTTTYHHPVDTYNY